MSPIGDDDPEVQRWAKFYRELIALNSSPAARRARELVFGSAPDGDLRSGAAGEPKRNEPRRGITAKELIGFLSLARNLLVNNFLMSHEGSKPVDIYRKAKVSRGDYHKWLRGAMKNSSDMAKRLQKRCMEV